MTKRKLLFVEIQNDENYWGDELATISKEYDVVALSYSEKIAPNFGCREYLTYNGNRSTIKYVLCGLSLFFSKVGWKEITDIWKNPKVNKIKCLIKSMLYYGEMKVFGKYAESRLGDFLRDAIIYTYWCHVCTLYFAIYREKYKIPLVITRMHGFDLYEERRDEGRQPFRWLINEKVDKIVVCGEKNQDYYFRTHMNVDRDKIIVGRLGCRSIGRSPLRNNDEFLMVSCSTVKELKRVNLIVDALSQIHDLNIKWIHFGENQIGEEFVRYCEDSFGGMNNINYELMGNVENDKVRQFYVNNCVDAFITTSSTEGAPVSIMEAMSAGIPIIGTAVGDIPSMIEGNGILLESNPSIEEIEKAIRSFVYMKDDIKDVRDKSYLMWDKFYCVTKNIDEFMRIIR